MKLVLSRVEEGDFDEILKAQYRAFEQTDMHQALFGPNTPENRDRVKNEFIKDMHTDVTDCWMKLVDEDSGRIVSCSQWKIFSSWVDKKKSTFEAPFWPEGSEERRISELWGQDFYDRKARLEYGESHVLLYILWTDPEFQRCGAGSIHVKWGTELADRLLLPCWVEGSPEGHHLYQSNGFKDVEFVDLKEGDWTCTLTYMRREAKKSIMAGRSITFT